VLGLLLFPASTGLASTASVTEFDVRYVAAPGETNDVVVTVDGTVFRISDPGVPISAGPGCVPSGADVLCDSGQFFFEVFINLGDGEDSADLSGIDLAVGMGGAGNDEIVGGRVENLLEGGPGNDRLTGGAGDDSVHGGGGDDQLLLMAGDDQASGDPGNDTISGGQGFDAFFGDPGDDILIGNSGRDFLFATGMNLRLTPTALVGQGSDTLGGIEDAQLFGGTGDNVINARAWRGRTTIFASGGDDVIVGGFGPDRIHGGLGNDRIAGRAGHDGLSGGPGADVLFSRDLQRDRVDGGLGRDRARVDRLDITRLIEVFFF
jgi:Ca2+-binding RTX toxin-like protein